MLIKIGNFDCTECWDGIFYKKLSDYPNITEWELQTIWDFIAYEAEYGRSCNIEADECILRAVKAYEKQYQSGGRAAVPNKITECTACPGFQGCMTDFVCHTSPTENAIKIFDCGSLLSPVKARGLTASTLKQERRNAANDPEDYFSYIMFAWGNCQAGDRLVMERKLNRFPNEADLSVFFTPGVRFFFRYDTLVRHPKAVFEGVLPLKVKDEIILKDWVYAIIVPTAERNAVERHIPKELRERVHYLPNDCKDIWEWSEKVYRYVRSI